jgi:hypothetical protein
MALISHDLITQHNEPKDIILFGRSVLRNLKGL